MLRHRRGRRRENAPVGVEPTRTAEAFSASGVGGCASRGAESALPCLGTAQFARLGDELVQGLVRVLAVAPPVGVGDPAAVGGAKGEQCEGRLVQRLGGLDLPVHVLWGEHDRIVDPAYGEAYAAAIPGATVTLLPRTGHLPQVETPEAVLEALLTPSRSATS